MKRPLLVLCLVFTGCSQIVTVKKDYNFTKLKRVALLQLEDLPGQPGSGKRISSLMEKSFLGNGCDLIERQKTEAILDEIKFQYSGAADPATVKKLGKLLGADSLVMGSVTLFSPEHHNIAYLEIWNETKEPIYETVKEKVKKGDQWIEVEKQVEKGHKTLRTVSKTPQDYVQDAEVGISIRMVDVETGEIIWTASDWEDGLNTQVATEILTSHIAKSVKKQVEKAIKGLASSAR